MGARTYSPSQEAPSRQAAPASPQRTTDPQDQLGNQEVLHQLGFAAVLPVQGGRLDVSGRASLGGPDGVSLDELRLGPGYGHDPFDLAGLSEEASVRASVKMDPDTPRWFDGGTLRLPLVSADLDVGESLSVDVGTSALRGGVTIDTSARPGTAPLAFRATVDPTLLFMARRRAARKKGRVDPSKLVEPTCAAGVPFDLDFTWHPDTGLQIDEISATARLELGVKVPGGEEEPPLFAYSVGAEAGIKTDYGSAAPGDYTEATGHVGAWYRVQVGDSKVMLWWRSERSEKMTYLEEHTAAEALRTQAIVAALEDGAALHAAGQPRNGWLVRFINDGVTTHYDAAWAHLSTEIGRPLHQYPYEAPYAGPFIDGRVRVVSSVALVQAATGTSAVADAMHRVLVDGA